MSTLHTFLSRSCAILLLLGLLSAPAVPGSGTVYLVLGSDTAIWEGMNTGRYDCTYTLTLYTDPGRNATAVMDPAFRSGLVDSYGTPLRMTWWMMMGNIFRHATNTNVPHPNTMTLHLMKKYQGEGVRRWGDELTLHYHTFVWSDYDADGRWYWNQARSFAESADDFTATLAAMLLEEETFPVSFRSGWHAMDNGWQARLDALIPFSLHNDWPAKHTDPVEPIDNVYDWSRAPSAFVPFHPSPADYQIPGPGRGWNVRSRYMSAADSAFMAKIFAAAAAGTDQVVCLWAHLPETDFLDNIRKVHGSTVKAAAAHPGTPFRYCTAVEAMQRWLRTADTTAPALALEEISEPGGLRWRISVDEPLFQPEPFVAVKTRYEEHHVLTVSPTAPGIWETTEPVLRSDVARIAAAVTDTAGNQRIAVRRLLPDDVYVDDADAGFAIGEGSWVRSASADWQAGRHVTASGAMGRSSVRWQAAIPADGMYSIALRLPALTTPVPRMVFRLGQGGVALDSIPVATAPPPGSWLQLGVQTLNAHEPLSVTMSTADTLRPGEQMGADVLRVSALVRERWLVAPPLIAAGDMVEDTTVTMDLTVRNDGILPVLISAASGLHGRVSIGSTFPATIPPMASRTLPLILHTGPAGSLEDTLILTSDDPRHPTVTIPVRGTVLPYFRIIDDLDTAGYRETGSWSTSVAQAFGTRSRYAYPAAGVGATFTARVSKAGTYDVQEIVPTTVNASVRARYVLMLEGVAVDTVFTDQNEGSGTWKTLFTRSLPAGAGVGVHLTDAMVPVVSGKVLRADAVRFQWRSDPTGVDDQDRTPVRFSLGPNFPNPFNPSTTIVFTTPVTARIEIRIFDILGRVVGLAAADTYGPGTHRIRWNAEGCPSGMYFARMTAVHGGGTVASTDAVRMLIVR